MRIILALFLPIFVVGLVTFLIRGLTPPESIRLAAGAEGGGYWQIGEQYRSKLERDGIAIELVETEGSVENIERLVSGDVDVAFVQGGISVPQGSNLESLGAVFHEPLVIFRHASAEVGPYPGQWRGIRLAAGNEGSGTRAAATALIEAAGLQDSGLVLIEAGGSEAIAAVRSGEADALMFVAPLDAPYLQEAILDPELVFVQMALVEALSFKFPDGHSAIVPAGSITLDPPRPPQDVKILTLTASLIAPSDLHPAVIDRLVHTAKKIHGDRNVLQEAREFPNTNSPPAPFNNDAWHLITSGQSVLHDFFPYWIAAQFGRVLLFLLPLIFLAPLFRIIPSGYVWFQNRRVWRHYQRITALEDEFAKAGSLDELETISRQLDEVDENLANLKLPLAYRRNAYDARLHIDLIRKEIERRRA